MILILLIAGILIIIFAYATLNLFQTAMANVRFLREFGWLAVQEGGLVQLAQIVMNGTIAMLSYIGFKLCESELVQRYQRWQNR
ncbi:hypothetical protein SLH49_21315 [Cognatiyoonia sp. IB215446]|uniref:hypothetical protein n=1 Tax=Cognatiyoonia sp. IB215446 TaxID=3097355 RepID=UPI002A11A058|nr:hypothetical protein [Cognatiyoonia sp. IB215446]MDX8350537.1 hypothetical protein [Cognatiyoonia sp. IB215446]